MRACCSTERRGSCSRSAVSGRRASAAHNARLTAPGEQRTRSATTRRGAPSKASGPTKVSNRHRRLRAQLRRMARTERMNHQRDAVEVARGVMRMGTRVAFESNSYRGWHASRYGRRMGFTAPGALMRHMAREARLAGGWGMEFETSESCAPSQHCLCGAELESRSTSACTCARTAGWESISPSTATCSARTWPG